MQFVVQPRLKNQDWSYCTHQRQTTDLYIRLHVIETSWKFKKTPKCANVLVDNIKIINKIKDPPPPKKKIIKIKILIIKIFRNLEF